ncbi:hypothetical protein [Acidipila sp. EB88]|uniref:hypothetical protein n=1 Tax=Acidipila sp. EB88 TaxID=2305226 RepID=UPI000F5D787D|nr:hypothetical protein [Acidipila sp. EB88]RRA48123.1 hypothetical protein D1Y84_07305 [Acidipila sp. EB88]
MHLWNDYEGTILAGQWTLGRLLRTEGRSALFATTKSDGSPAVLRLTEALNDQAVLRARYQTIQAAGDRYLVAVEGFGDAELDGAPLSYAVLEPTQESLAEILAQRPLSPEETYEVAVSVAGGLVALHAQGLVHSLVEPESVLAATDRIKLRSDCARPAPSDEDALLEGAVTQQTDAFGLAGIIYQSLTQGRLHDASDALALPEPFATIVRNTARGSWGAREIQEELTRPARAAAAPVPVPAPVAPAVATSVPVASAEAASVESAAVTTQPFSSRSSVVADTTPASGSSWSEPQPVAPGSRRGVWIGIGIVILLALLFLLFHHGGSSPKAAAPASQPTAVSPAPVPTPASAPVHKVVTPAAATAAAPKVAPETAPVVPGGKVWRVIAYTYNRRDEASHKAAIINDHYRGFNAEVWSRTGQRPFLVTIGGEMTRQQAFVLRERARRAGMARDVYAQDYAR